MTQSVWKIIFGHCEAVPKIVHVQMCLKLEVPEAAEQRIQTLFWPNIQPRRLEKGIATFNRSWRISTTPNTTKIFLIIFKLIQQAIMVILSCLAKKNQNLNLRKKSSVYY